MNKPDIDGVTLYFLSELTALSKKYNRYIGGCNCCGSPYIYSKDSPGNLADNVGFDSEKEYYTADK